MWYSAKRSRLVYVVAIGFVLAFTNAAAACEWGCGTGCCCPGVSCLCGIYTEFKCWNIGAGGTMTNCINVGSQCPWQGCGGWSCGEFGESEDLEIMSVEVGQPLVEIAVGKAADNSALHELRAALP